MIVLSFDHQVCFHVLITYWQLKEAICHFVLESVVPITHKQNIILQQNTFKRYYARADHYLWAIICRSCVGLSANGKEENNASNDN